MSWVECSAIAAAHVTNSFHARACTFTRREPLSSVWPTLATLMATDASPKEFPKALILISEVRFEKVPNRDPGRGWKP